MSRHPPDRERQAEEFIDDLLRIGEHELVTTAGLAADQARAAMRRVADAVCAQYARSSIYVPVGYDPRNREIVTKYGQASRSAGAYTPERIAELAREYALTTRQIYSILRTYREAEFAQRQGTLPGLDADDDSAV
ncbi:MAG: Mor transcription activator family [Pseudomonadota bacterium]|jgi:Mor family transcriptional regulator